MYEIPPVADIQSELHSSDSTTIFYWTKVNKVTKFPDCGLHFATSDAI